MVAMSQADIADRLTILILKGDHGLHVDPHELRMLADECDIDSATYLDLREANRKAWDVVGKITDCFEGRIALTDAEVRALCAEAHALNKQRVAVKNRINMARNSPVEHKTWQ